MKNAEIDRLGERIVLDVSANDLTALDTFRRGFRPTYDIVVDRIRSEIGLEASGRPAKSTTAIIEKLKRGSMRLTQRQDIAGCRIVISDVTAQNLLVRKLESMFQVVVVDRRTKPSHGYGAVHVVIRSTNYPLEVQLRTELQHLWAELSEKLSDTYGTGLKYGGGPAHIRHTLDDFSNLIAEFENTLDADDEKDARAHKLKIDIHRAMLNVGIALRQQ